MINTVDEDVTLIRIQVAERLGWRSIEYSNDGYLIGYPSGRKVLAVVPSYARDIKAAWSLVDYLSLHGIRTHVRFDSIGKSGRFCSVELEYHEKLISRAQEQTATLAICQAFLNIRGDQLVCSQSFCQKH